MGGSSCPVELYELPRNTRAVHDCARFFGRCAWVERGPCVAATPCAPQFSRSRWRREAARMLKQSMDHWSQSVGYFSTREAFLECLPQCSILLDRILVRIHSLL